MLEPRRELAIIHYTRPRRDRVVFNPVFSLLEKLYI